jgi:hypothetical protein
MLTALVIAAVVVIGVLVASALRPNTFRVERATVIKAAPDKIYPLINDLHLFNTWNPYEKMDPQIKGSYSGTQSGMGAAYSWESTKVGSGRMEIVEATPSRKVVMKLDFLKPFEGHNTAEFTLEPKAGETAVIWAMHGPLAFVPKLMGLFMPMDRMIGKSFESGLANLKAAAES